MNSKGRFALKLFLIFITALIGIYLFGVLLFSGHFQFRTYVNGMSVSFSSPEEVAYMYNRSSKDLSVSFLLKDGYVETMPFAGFGITRKDDNNIVKFSQNAWLWPMSLFEDTRFDVGNDLVWTRDGLEKGVVKLQCMDESLTSKPIDAYVSIDDAYHFHVIPEVYGNRLDKEKVVDALNESLEHMNLSVDLVAKDCYYQPNMLSDDPVLKDVCDKANEIVNLNIKLDLGCGYAAVVPRGTLYECIFRSGGTVSVRYDPLRRFVRELAEKYNTIDTTRRFQTTMDGYIRLVPASTDNFIGWEMDVEKTVKDMNSMLRNRESGIVDATWKSVGKSHGQDNDFGNTYIELSIKRQHMWLYVDGVIRVDTDVTTGKDTDDLRTPTGMFRTLDFKTDFTMTGDGYTAYSKYFIQVTADGVGIHDASWRSVYGGDDWVDRGSHGCINTPYDAVQDIFLTLTSRSSQSVPVIIY